MQLVPGGCIGSVQITTRLWNSQTVPSRFNDEEKAQLFIGYLASFSEKEMKLEEESNHES